MPILLLVLLFLSFLLSLCVQASAVTLPVPVPMASFNLHTRMRSHVQILAGNLMHAELVGCPSVDFAATVTIGNQSFELLVDTGSTTTAVASKACTNCNVSPLYSPSASAVFLGYPFSAKFVDNSQFTATVYQELVGISGIKPFPLRIGAIDSQSKFFIEGCVSGAPALNQGILGLGFTTAAFPKTDSFLDHLTKQANVPDILSLQLCHQHGRMWVGGYDVSAFSAPPSFTPMVRTGSGFYVVELFALSVDDAVVEVDVTAFGAAVIDTGSSSFSVPSAVAARMNSLLMTNKHYKRYFGRDFMSGSTCINIPGKTTAQLNQELPQLTLHISGITLELNAINSYIVEQYDNDHRLFYCSGVGSLSEVHTVLGWSILNQFTVIIDRGDFSVGFAPSECHNDVLPSQSIPRTNPDYSLSSLPLKLLQTATSRASCKTPIASHWMMFALLLLLFYLY